MLYNVRSSHLKKNFISIVLILMMVAGLFGSLPFLADINAHASTSATINASNGLNVRSGAGTSYKVLGTLSHNTGINILDTVKGSDGKNWYKISYNSQNGYVHSSYVKLASSTQKSPAGSIIDAYSPSKSGTTSESLNLRTGPSTSYSVSATVAKGTKLTVTGRTTFSGQNWYRISYGSKTLYASATYINISSSSSTTEPETEVGTVTGKGVTTTYLNLRTGASTNYTVYTTVNPKTTLTVTGKVGSGSNAWYKVSYSGKTLYASAAYVTFTADEKPEVEETPTKGSTTAYLNLRTGASTSSSIYTTVKTGTVLTITGTTGSGSNLWYKVSYSGKTLYAFAEYVKVTETSGGDTDTTLPETTDNGIEDFPESYQAALTALSEDNPQWKFVPIDTNMTWEHALGRQVNDNSTGVVGTSLIHSSLPEAWRSMNKGTYDFTNDKYGTADGGWNFASDDAVAYYLDPRNWLKEDYIFQFMGHGFDAESQSPSTVKKMSEGTFLETRKTSKGEYLYNVIYTAGKNSGVNPNVLASMIIQEQGTSGSSDLISGDYPGYEGYYNFFNIGAFNESGFTSAIHRGLWYAAGSGKGYTSYDRPWKTVGSESGEYRSILGGAEFYASSYVENNQDTLYTKKFNVANGASAAGTYQYMTNVSGAASEGWLLAEAYEDSSDMPIVFYIPVYDNMPSTAAARPTEIGNNNNLLDSLTVKSGSTNIGLGKTFDRYTETYSVSTTASTITIGASANDSGAKITGTGTKTLEAGLNKYTVSVKSTSGETRTYTINVTKK